VTPLERITERVSRNGDINDSSTPRPLLTLEEFFDGNDVDGSIWCNCTPTPSPPEAYAILKAIRDRDGVADVRVEVHLFDEPEWPFSEVDYVVTDAPPEQVKSWFPRDVAPDDIQVVDGTENTDQQLVVPTGMQVVYCWWD
jgi:hypothetical protein